MLKPAHVTCSFSITCGILLFSKMPLSSSQPEPGRLSKSGGSLCARRRRRSPPPAPRPSPDASRCPLSARSVTPAFSQERWGGDCHMIASCPSRFPEHGSADRLPGVSRTHASASAWVPHCPPMGPPPPTRPPMGPPLPARPLPRAPSLACDARSSTSCARAVPARFPVSAASGPPSSSALPALVSPSLSLPCRSHVWSPRPSRRCLPSRATPRHLDQPFTFPLRDLRPPWRPLSAVLCGCREASAGIVRRGFSLARPVFTRSPGRPRPQASPALVVELPLGK